MISIIVPVYNVEKYIEKCLESIMSQSYSDFEVLVIDDGSTDDSGMIADRCAERDPRITVFHKDNGGLSDARNYGIDRAKGEYFCFIDSDDWIEHDYLEELMNLLTTERACIAICAYMRNPGDEEPQNVQNPGINCETGIEAIDNLYGEHYGEYVVAWNKLYRRQIFNDIRYPKGMIHEDEAICGEIYCRASRVVRTEKILYNYRVNNSSSIMSERYSLKRLDILKALEMRMDTYKREGLQKYYEKDSFKYLYKILLNIDEIKKLTENNSSTINDLRSMYWKKYRETMRFDWSIKRKAGMFFFGIFPGMYRFRYRQR